MKQARGTGGLMLLLAAVIWGSAFVAQSMGMDHIGPFTFQAVRSLMGAAALVPVILLFEKQRKSKPAENKEAHFKRRDLLLGGVLCGLTLFVAINLQQFGLLYTTPGKAGFLTAMYILIVPIYGLFLGHKPPLALWVSVAIAVMGLYLLSVTEQFTVSIGDILLILCAIAFAGQIMLIGLVNTFSDSLLSRDFEGRIVVTVEPFNWREIIKVLLDAGGIVKAVDEGENALRRFLPGAEPADGVYQLLLED